MYITNIRPKSEVRKSLPLLNSKPDEEQQFYQWQTLMIEDNLHMAVRGNNSHGYNSHGYTVPLKGNVAHNYFH